MAVPYTFGSATTSIPLSQLDSNFATAITLGNTAVQLGNTITTLTGVTNVASSGSLTLGTSGNTTAVTIDTSQNVGIGLTPSAWSGTASGNLQVGAGGSWTTFSSGPEMDFGNNFYYASGWTYKNTGPAQMMQIGNSSVPYKFLYAGSGTAGNAITWSEAMRIDSSSNVLVGATTPYSGTVSNFTASTGVDIGSSSTATSKQLQFIRSGSTGTAGNIYATGGSFSNYCGIEFVIDNVGGGSQAGYLKFNTTNNASSAERARIDATGYLLVGCTTYPSSSVAGVAFSPSVLSVNPHRFSVGSGTSVTTVMTFVNGNGIVGAINTSGSNTVYATSSDYRLKKDIAPMTGSLEKVSLLKPCTYKWKSDNSDGQGFIAHELAEVFPDAVVGEKDAVDVDGEIKSQQIDTSFLVATLTAAIQELKAINDQQAETINALTARIVALEAK
jgi:Chaperone of endosialidase